MMIEENAKNQACCPREEIAAYVDGEITPRAELELEMHFAGCKTCAEELNSQKQLLCALDSFCLNEREIELPENFTKVIVATAESNVSGLRLPQERRTALFICAALFLLVLLGLVSEPGAVLGTFGKFAEQFLAVSSFVVHLIFDIAVGIAIVLRFLGHHFVFSSVLTFGFIAVLFMLSLLTLSRLVLRYNRV